MTQSRLDAERRGLSAGADLPVAVAVGLLLGAAAITADRMTLPGTRLLVLASSTGLSWGAAAVGCGALARDRRTAAVAGGLAPLTAVVVYYAGIALLDLRPNASVTRAAVTWSVAALAGGPFAGVAGWYARHGDRKRRALAWGTLAGLLLGQGIRWAADYGLALDPVFTPALVVPAVLVAWGARDGGRRYAGAALVVASGLSACAWTLLARLAR